MSPRLLGLVVSITFVPAAMAADIEWSGSYIGLFAGYADANDAWGSDPGMPALSPEGAMFGGLAGYTHNIDGLVFGVEADLVFPDFSDTGACSVPHRRSTAKSMFKSCRRCAAVAVSRSDPCKCTEPQVSRWALPKLTRRRAPATARCLQDGRRAPASNGKVVGACGWVSSTAIAITAKATLRLAARTKAKSILRRTMCGSVYRSH